MNEIQIIGVETVTGEIVNDWEMEQDRNRDEMDYCELCGHYHLHLGEEHPEMGDCSDYRCCEYVEDEPVSQPELSAAPSSVSSARPC